MKEVEFFAWWIHDDRGKLHRSRWKMSREEAQQRYPNAVAVQASREVRFLPEGPHEYEFNSKPPTEP